MINRIKELVDELNYHTKLYDEGNPILTDEQWDKLYFELVGLENLTGIYLGNSPTQKIVYSVVNDLKKVKHDHPMLSLQKTQSIDEINNFIGNKPYIIMLKIDGLTCSLGYENGRLVSAETRGDGEIGEDVLHNANIIKNIPKKIPYKGKLTVDGEIICKTHIFKKYYANEYKNPRNFASGSIRLLDSRECDERCLSFIAWDAVNFYTDEIFTLSERLGFLQELGFEVTDFTVLGNFNEHNIEFFKDSANRQGIPIDGLVVKYNDCRYYDSLGKTDHHFRGGMAFKFYDETYETRLIGIEWTMGRTGVLTPVAVFEPVEIDGCEVSRASLHNVSILNEILGIPYINQPIEVYKANQIIPQIKKAEKVNNIDSRYLYAPKACPICGGMTVIETLNDSSNLVCVNTNCEGKLINKLDHFCGKKGLDIKGLSKATLEKLIDWNWIKSYEDIFNLKDYKLDWINKAGFGEKSVSNILAAIEESKKCNLDKFIAALGIPLIGTRAAKDLADNFHSWSEFIKAIETNFKFYVLPNFGVEMHNSLTTFDYSEATKLAEQYLTILDTEQETKVESELKDKTIVITGKLIKFKNRDELKEKIETLGGKVSGSISGKTSYLINNDVNSTSSKNMSAKKLNVPIVSEEDFCKMFGI
jgi:DNA ligase (NAD+)